MPEDTTYIKQLIKKSNRIETHAGTTGLNDFTYLDGNKVSPNINYHIMYLNDGKEVYVTELDFDENKSEIIIRRRNETDYKEYVRSMDGSTPPFQVSKSFKFKTRRTDAKKGFVKRAFIRIASNEDAVPVEIKPTGYSSVPPTFKKVMVKWKITGDVDEIKKHNINELEKAEKLLTGLSLLTMSALDGYIPLPEDEERQEIEKKLDRMNSY